MLKPLQFGDLVNVVRTLRINDVSADILPDLSDDQLCEMFSAPGTFVRLQKHVQKLRTRDNDTNMSRSRADTMTQFDVLRYRLRGLRTQCSGLHQAVIDGNLQVVTELLHTRRASINQRDKFDFTSLHLAALYSHEHIVSFLLGEEDLDFEALTQTGRTAFSVALSSKQHDIAVLLARDERANSIMLHEAILHGEQQLVEIFLQKADIDINSFDGRGSTPLINSIRHGHIKITERLLRDRRIRPALGDGSATPLHYASTLGQHETVSSLLEHDHVDVNVLSRKQYSPMQLAIIYEHMDVACLLIQHGKVRSSDQEWALRKAAKFDYHDVLELVLINEDVNPNSHDAFGRNALDISLKYENFEFAEHLLESPRIDPSQSGVNVLHRAVRSGRSHLIQKLLNAEGIDAAARNASGDTVLCVALQERNLHIAEQLLINAPDHIEAKLRAATRQCDNPGLVAFIHKAATQGDIELFKFLSRHDLLNANATDSHGDTVLHILGRFAGRSRKCDTYDKDDDEVKSNDKITRAHCRILSTLLQWQFVNVNEQNELGETPLHILAQTTRDTSMLKLLIRHNNLNPNVTRASTGNTPLHDGAKLGNAQFVDILLNHERVRPNAKNACDETALELALKNGHIEVAEFLLQDERTGFGPKHVKDKCGNLALHLAAKMPSARIVEILLQKHRSDDVDVNALNGEGESAFMIALRRTHSCEAASALLLDERVDTSVVDSECNTALHLASRLGNSALGIVKTLVADNLVNVNAQNDRGETALHVALRSYEGSKLAECILQSKEIDSELVRYDDGNTILHMAAMYNHSNIVLLLLQDERVHVDDENSDGFTARDLAEINGYDNLKELFDLSATTGEGF